MEGEGNMTSLMNSFLSDRLFRVRVRKTQTGGRCSTCIVPSVTWFIVTINSIIDEVSSPVHVSLFVDDVHCI